MSNKPIGNIEFKIIAHIKSGFNEKFGIPRQSGIIEDLPAQVIFEDGYGNAESVRGLEGYSHIWLLWLFSEAMGAGWSPTVRPPKLGGNKRMGVFASRSPYRPNPIALSSVRLQSIEYDSKNRPILNILGADLLDGTPILDIKPYLPYTDSHPEAKGGFALQSTEPLLEVIIAQDQAEQLPSHLLECIKSLLAQDPRPGYQKDPDRQYALQYGGYELHFKVCGQTLTICDIKKL